MSSTNDPREAGESAADGWSPMNTALGFGLAYAERSGVTLSWLHEQGQAVRPCACHEEGCEGWMMVNAEQYDADVLAWLRGEGPHPGRLSDAEAAEWDSGQESD